MYFVGAARKTAEVSLQNHHAGSWKPCLTKFSFIETYMVNLECWNSPGSCSMDNLWVDDWRLFLNLARISVWELVEHFVSDFTEIGVLDCPVHSSACIHSFFIWFLPVCPEDDCEQRTTSEIWQKRLLFWRSVYLCLLVRFFRLRERENPFTEVSRLTRSPWYCLENHFYVTSSSTSRIILSK